MSKADQAGAAAARKVLGKKTLKSLREQGLSFTINHGGHIRILDGNKTVATLSVSASDRRSIKNTIAAIRRAGYTV